jgi:RND family efflux transporter MFP subunit
LRFKLGLGAGAVILAGALMAANSGPVTPAAPATARILPVETAMAVEIDSYQEETRFVGRIEAARSSQLGFELAGTVMSLLVDEGDRVEEGQLLAALDTARLEAEHKELEATLQEAQASQRLALVTFERVERAVKGGAVSKQRLDESKREIDAAAAVVSRVEAQIDAIDVNDFKSKLRAPYTGVVVDRHVDEGSVLSPGSPVLRILESERLEIRVGLTSDAVHGLRIGSTIPLLDSTGKELISTVKRILPERSQTTRTIDVILGVRNGEPNLRDGDLVDVLIPREIAATGIWLPRSALTESVRGLWATYALEPTGTEDVYLVARRQLEILHQSGDRLFVRGAVQDGEQIVQGGLHRIVPGQRVRPVHSLETIRTNTAKN